MTNDSATTFAVQTLPIIKLFASDRFYTIPPYQRPYLWKEDELQDFFDDLNEAKTSDDYFLGTIVLFKNQQLVYEIVDGQQRITTLIIFFACLRDVLAETGDANLQQYADDTHATLVSKKNVLRGNDQRPRLFVPSSPSFEEMFFEPKSTLAAPRSENTLNDAEKRYEYARKFFQSRLTALQEEEGNEGITTLVTFMAQKCRIVELTSTTFENAYRLFEIVNDRGVQLRNIDLLKSYNLDPKFIIEEQRRTAAAKRWEALEDRLGAEEFEKALSVLRLIYLRRKPKYDLFREYKEFVLDNRKSGEHLKPGDSFITELQHKISHYSNLFVDFDLGIQGEEGNKVSSLLHLMGKYLTTYEWRAPLLKAAISFPRENMLAIASRIELFTLGLTAKATRKDERFNEYIRILELIPSGGSSDLSWLDEIKPDTEAIRTVCQSRNFYDSRLAKYLLTRAELLVSEFGTPHHYAPASIEHVLPQTPDPNSEWVRIFTDADREELTHTAGNLVLLSRSKNSSAQNRDFEQKKKTYLEPKVSAYPRSNAVCGVDSWTPEVIRRRTEQFVTLSLSSFADA